MASHDLRVMTSSASVPSRTLPAPGVALLLAVTSSRRDGYECCGRDRCCNLDTCAAFSRRTRIVGRRPVP
jgi:hypothetical protein